MSWWSSHSRHIQGFRSSQGFKYLYSTCNCETSTSPEFNPIKIIPGFFPGVVPGGGGVFHLHPVIPLYLKLDDSNFVQNYFRAGSKFWGKKNRDQIENDVTMTSSFL